MKSLTVTIRDHVRSIDHATCAEVAVALAPALGYEPSLPTVSRALASLGWEKTVRAGKVAYNRTQWSEQ